MSITLILCKGKHKNLVLSTHAHISKNMKHFIERSRVPSLNSKTRSKYYMGDPLNLRMFKYNSFLRRQQTGHTGALCREIQEESSLENEDLKKKTTYREIEADRERRLTKNKISSWDDFT